MTYSPRFFSLLSTDNNSTTAIDNGDNFTGEWEDIQFYPEIMIAVKTDQNGYFEIQFSTDATNIDSTLTRYYRTTQIEAPHRFTKTRRYFRIIFYNNSGSNQTFFRLQTHKGQFRDLNIPADATMAQDYDAVSVRPTDFTTETALGLRQGFSTWNKFGYNTSVGTSAEIIASWGGTFQFITTGETITIASSSTADTNTSGAGAQKLVIYGVDSNWDEQIEVVNMNGTTNVVTTSTWLGINRVAIYLAGTGLTNAGTITVTATTSGYTMAQMPTSNGTTQQSLFYVPRDHKFLATWLYLSALKSSGGGNPSITYEGKVFSAVSNAKYNIFLDELDTQVGEHISINTSEPFVVGEKSILWFEATGSAANSSVKCRFSGKLVRDFDA